VPALKAGVNAKIVSQRLGHASVGFTLTVYSHAPPGYDREAVDVMATLILGGVDEEVDEVPRQHPSQRRATSPLTPGRS
jgi:hypothetical protein